MVFQCNLGVGAGAASGASQIFLERGGPRPRDRELRDAIAVRAAITRLRLVRADEGATLLAMIEKPELPTVTPDAGRGGIMKLPAFVTAAILAAV